MKLYGVIIALAVLPALVVLVLAGRLLGRISGLLP